MPATLPPNTRPPFVASKPEVDRGCTWYSHTRSPVSGSSARTALTYWSPGPAGLP